MDGKQHDERFVAGAVCPACHALDRIVVFVRADDGIERQRCVSCGFVKEGQGRPVESTQPRLRGKRDAAALDGTPSEAVRIVDPDDS